MRRWAPAEAPAAHLRILLAVATWAEALPLVGFHPVVTGMGARVPSLAGYERVVSAGFAGACDPALRAGDLVTGPLETLDHIASPAEKAALRGTGVQAVDMEGRWLAAAAAEAALPFTSVRVVIDRVQDPAFSLATAAAFPRAALALRRAVVAVLTAPVPLPPPQERLGERTHPTGGDGAGA
ncbi:MAG: hypothetical protein JO247_20990 [Chloroflexi bacterium]|nr:hypothetical protein [Chloroflexota bacterium]